MATPAGLTHHSSEFQSGTNYHGHALPVQLLRASLLHTAQQGHESRIIVVSSFGHTLAPPSCIDFENLRNANASVSIHPGLMRTRLSSGVEASSMTPVPKLMRWTPVYQSAKRSAYIVLWAATGPQDQVQNGIYYEPVGSVPEKVSKGLGQSELIHDESLAERLWEWSEKELSDVIQ